MEKQYLSHVRCLDPLRGTEQRLGVLRQGQQILAIEPQTISEECITANGEHLLLAPGLVDLYSTSGEPGHEDRETLAQLLQTAIAGGFTEIGLTPQTTPAIDNITSLHWLQQNSSKDSSPLPLVRQWGSLTIGNQGRHLTDLAELADAGVAGFMASEGITEGPLLRRALEYAAMLHKPLALLPLDDALRGNGVMRDDTLAIQLGLSPDPAMSETAAIARLLELLPEYETPVHLMKISTAQGVALVKQAKSQQLPLTASVNWHHLLLSNIQIAQGIPPYATSYDPNLRFNPPLGREADRLALLEGIKTGLIDAIAVDHHAFSYEDKTQSFAETQPGAIGYELILPCLWQQLVEPGILTIHELWRALTTNVWSCWGLSPKPTTQSWILFDPASEWTVTQQTLKTPASNTPWWGHRLQGRVIATSSAGTHDGLERELP